MFDNNSKLDLKSKVGGWNYILRIGFVDAYQVNLTGDFAL